MRVQHNFPALNARGYLNKNVAGLKRSSERLASGYRINHAIDDAAGLAVSEKLRSQLRGINQASRNCQDGINLVQTFEGALSESQSIIQRCKELAAEAANGTYDDLTDREAVELEYQQLCKELDAISDTDFNGLCMLNGGKIQAPKDSGMFWASPTSLNLIDGTFENNTNDPNFNMTISKLPGLDEMTLIDETEKKALEELQGSTIGVKLDDGEPVFYFKPPEPSNVYVTTSGIKGTVYVKGNSGAVTPIAEVHITGVDVKNVTTGRGTWYNTSGGVSVTKNPKCLSTPAYGKLNATSNSDPYDGSSINLPRRKEFYDWLDSIPKSNTVSFKVTDDRKHFTIIGDTSFFKEMDGTAANNDKEYDLGTKFIMTTKSSADSNRSETDFTWDDAEITVSWNADTIRPGEDFSLSTRDDYKSSSGFSASKSFIESYDNKGKPKWEYLYASESIGQSNGGTACPNTSSETFPGAETTSHNFWLEHGSYSFTLTYNAATKRWSASVSGSGSKTYNENSAEFNAIVSKFGLSLTTAKANLDKAYSRGYYVLDDSSDETKGVTDPRYRIPTNGRSTFSFSLSYNAPSLDSSLYQYWSTSSTNYDLQLGKYDPANPSRGGIDYESAVTGTYRYVNDDKINTKKSGYWVDGTGKKINLEDVGVYLPEKYNYDVLPSEKYDSTHYPLHDGLTISVTTKLTGPTGEASAKIKIWEKDPEFIPMINDNPRDYGLTYSNDLDIQSNSRSKDVVKFTFVYHADGVGDLICDTNCSAEGLGLKELSIADQESANYLIDKLDEALNKVSMVRSTFGSIQNRLEKKVSNLAVSNENLSTSESEIRDSDMALEVMNYTKSSILQQAAQTMIAQTSRQPETILKLIGQ